VTLGTRGSDLALAQSRQVASSLAAAAPGVEVSIRVIKTTGDARLDVRLAAPGSLDKGLFTKELETALMDQSIDAAVHSLKDLPTQLPDGLRIGAVLERADDADVLAAKVAGGLVALPVGATVATSSPRRKFQLLARRPDLVVVEIRGNVPTRLRRLAETPSLDALVLAKAGLDRLGWEVVPDGIDVTILADMLPAPGQGAIAIECRESDAATRAVLGLIHHEPTARCVNAEREFLRSLGGGCSVPVAARARIVDGEIVMDTFVAPGFLPA
jgi:hydroxymethylbilane synthase